MAIFVSQHRGLRITMEHTDSVTYANGLHEVRRPGVVISFAPKGQISLDDEADADKIAFLRGHRWFGTRFEELGAKAKAQRPTLLELSKAITGATATLNVEKLDELLDTEMATHNREDAIAMIENARSAVADLTPASDDDELIGVSEGTGDDEEAALAETVGIE